MVEMSPNLLLVLIFSFLISPAPFFGVMDGDDGL